MKKEIIFRNNSSLENIPILSISKEDALKVSWSGCIGVEHLPKLEKILREENTKESIEKANDIRTYLFHYEE